jgi:hypothetical protein
MIGRYHKKGENQLGSQAGSHCEYWLVSSPIFSVICPSRLASENQPGYHLTLIPGFKKLRLVQFLNA